MNSAGSYVQESSRKQGPKGMKGKTRHVTSTPPSPTNTQTHASFVFRSRRSSGMLIQLAQLAKPGTKKNSSNSSRNHCFPHGAAFLAYAAPLSTAVTWLERLLLLGCWAILFLLIFFLPIPWQLHRGTFGWHRPPFVCFLPLSTFTAMTVAARRGFSYLSHCVSVEIKDWGG